MPESVEKLHRELADFIRAKDDEGLRRVYRELLRTGRSRPEIIDEVIHLVTARHDTPENTLNSSDLIGSARPRDKIELNTAEHTRHLIYRAAEALQRPTDLDSSVIETIAKKAPDDAVAQEGTRQVIHPGGHFPARRWTGRRPLVFTIAALAAASFGGLLLPHEIKDIAATAPTATRTDWETSASGSVGAGWQATEQAASPTTSTGAPDAPAATVPAPASPSQGTLADNPSTLLPGTAPTAATPDPAIPRSSLASTVFGDGASGTKATVSVPSSSTHQVSRPDRRKSIRRSRRERRYRAAESARR
jgi:hypothetical protein